MCSSDLAERLPVLLIVDDEVRSLESLTRILQDDFDVKTAANVARARDILQPLTPDSLANEDFPYMTMREITVGDVGVVQKLTVTVDVANSDITTLEVFLYDPNNVEYVLFDKGQAGNAIKTSYPNPTATVAGDLSKWVGKNPTGKWSLTVIDTGFLNNKSDGQINAWSVSVKTVSSQKVAANGGFQFKSYTKDPVVCGPNHFGFTYVNSADKTLRVAVEIPERFAARLGYWFLSSHAARLARANA